MVDGTFASVNPETGEKLGIYPVSSWAEIDEALDAGYVAYEELRSVRAGSLASFLERFAERIESVADHLVEMAHQETALPRIPRLTKIELPRTADQLRQAGEAARYRSWKEPILSPSARIASLREPIPGIVCVFGPNNFPFAFNSVAGGDFAAAVATGHPVLAKANPGHPGTTRLLAAQASSAAEEVGLPKATIQMIYKTSHDNGYRLVADSRVAATGYTGSRHAGLGLKQAAEAAGRLIYLEMSSVNPVVVLPGAWLERGESVVEELVGSLLAGSGQFCTSPGLIFTPEGNHLDGLRGAFKELIEAAPPGTLLGEGVASGLVHAFEAWTGLGATTVAQASEKGPGCSFPNAMLEVSGEVFLENPSELQQEAFGNLSLLIVTRDGSQLVDCIRQLEGNLTGSIYSATDGVEEDEYWQIAPVLRERVGRLLNNKVPTGVAVVPSMNHGGPFPATGHPGFTSVGIPASLKRFSMLHCFDNVPDHRLPAELRASNPLGLQRYVDRGWTSEPITWGP